MEWNSASRGCHCKLAVYVPITFLGETVYRKCQWVFHVWRNPLLRRNRPTDGWLLETATEEEERRGVSLSLLIPPCIVVSSSSSSSAVAAGRHPFESRGGGG